MKHFLTDIEFAKLRQRQDVAGLLSSVISRGINDKGQAGLFYYDGRSEDEGPSITMPSHRQTILEEFECYKGMATVKGIGITGSAIMKGDQSTDLEIVLFVDSVEEFERSREYMMLPEQIEGKHLKIWAKTYPVVSSRPILDLETLTLHVPNGFKVGRVDARINVPAAGDGQAERPARRPCSACNRTLRSATFVPKAGSKGRERSQPPKR